MSALFSVYVLPRLRLTWLNSLESGRDGSLQHERPASGDATYIDAGVTAKKHTMNGFCPHPLVIPGLDAYYCKNCKKSIAAGTTAYAKLLRRRLFFGTTHKEAAEIRRRRGGSYG